MLTAKIAKNCRKGHKDKRRTKYETETPNQEIKHAYEYQDPSHFLDSIF
jgi:hypothetical protein